VRTPSILTRRPALAGIVMIAIAGLATVLLFQKSAILTALTPGETITVQLARDYKIVPYQSVVKMAGTKIGVVRSVAEPDPDRPGSPVEMTLKVQNGIRALLGSAPTVVIRPTTVLGGTYYVELASGGDPGEFTSDAIPVNRTRLPVELDRLLSAIPPDAQRGLQGMTERLDSTLKAGAGDALRPLLAHAPDTLTPAGVVLDAVRGVNRDADLARLVTDLNTSARVLSAKPGQLRAVVDSLATTSRVLGDNAGPIDQTIASFPDTLRATRSGADDLSGTLDKLTDTADDARPAVRALDPLLRKLDPTLHDLRELLGDLRPLLEDAKPLVKELVPTVDSATDVLHDLNGTVLDRINGPILGTLLSEWHGQWPKYPNGGGNGNTFYQELGYMFAHIDQAVQYQNATAHLLGFQAGAGSTSIYGDGMTAQQLQDLLSEGYGPPHRKPVTPLLPGVPGLAAPDPGVPSPTVAVPDLPTLTEGPGR